jgi:hypothetical protein
MSVKIALDGNIGKKRCNELIGLGYNVVTIAQTSEADEEWVYKAFNAGARFIVSNDFDIPKLIEKEGYPMVWINYPMDNLLYKDWLVQYLDQMIRFKINFFKRIVEEAK